jgi:uncharacterized tellurite resistance protein B-like protein
MSFLQEFHLSEQALASFASGMREVARSDEHVHPNELALIDSLMEGVSVVEEFNSEALSDNSIKENFMLMLALVAVSDGKVLDCELEVIERYAEELNISVPVSDYIEMAALSLLSQYTDAEVEVIAPKLGGELGLSEDGILKAVKR